MAAPTPPAADQAFEPPLLELRENAEAPAREGDAVAPAEDRRVSRGTFARHFAEMVLVMLTGMGVLEGLAALALAAAGSSLGEQSGLLRLTLMGLSMTLPMLLWMHYRGHPPARSAEMAGSMLVPTALAAGLFAAGSLGLGAAFALQHAVMVPAMLGVMLWRYHEYAGARATDPHLRTT